ncbi:MAG: hypothetical protein J0L50_09545 [Sphingomonadales bacterium]|nr:hypothetical protein [Sphingomonadales bacterium]
MNAKTRLQPGDLWIIAGMILTLGGAILLPVVMLGQNPEFARLKAEGMVVQATIAAKQNDLAASTRRRQVGTSENFYFEVVFDPARGVPFGQHGAAADAPVTPTAKPRSGADIVAGLDIGKPRPAATGLAGAGARARLNAGSFERFEAHDTGDVISVTYLPTDPGGARLTELVEDHDPLPGQLGGGALLLGGIGVMVSGFRRRKRAAERV